MNENNEAHEHTLSLRARLTEAETNSEVWRDNYKQVALQLEKSCPTEKLREAEAKLAESAANEAALRKALEFYANERNWIMVGDVGAILRNCDGWEKAREALAAARKRGWDD